ncbi:MAG: acyl-CoA dehydrogenase [Myxococcales bacterium]
MDLDLSSEQRMVQSLAREFAQAEVAPLARELDRTARFPSELVKRLGELGLLGVAIPEAEGGAGLDTVSYALAVEEISAACASLGAIMSVNNSLVCDPLHQHGTPSQKETFLRPLASGQALGCFGLTEPMSGSDASRMATVAEREGDAWILRGSKNFITNGPHADVMLVFCVTDRGLGARGVTAFLVPRGTPGYVPQKHDEKLGIHAAHSCTVFFEDCRISDAQRLGELGTGFRIAMATLDGGRIGIAAQALGIARAAHEKAVAYAKERHAFGEPIANKQAIQFMLADMSTELEAARLLILRAAWLKDQGQARFTQESAMAKLYASEMSHRVCHRALQIFGGYGYTTEYDLERHYRDSRITEIYEGTSEIMRLVIAAQALKR